MISRPLALVLLLGALTPARTFAQTKSIVTGSVADSSRATPDSVPRLDDESVHGYLMRTIGPLAFIKAAAVAGVAQALHSPKAWPRNRRGYADRYGSSLGAGAMASTVRFGLSNVLHERIGDFVPCGCHDFAPRLGHAAAIPFRAYSSTGAHPSLLTPLSDLASAVLVTAVRPGGFNVRDGVRNGAASLAVTTAISVVHEFWPWPWSIGQRLLGRRTQTAAPTTHAVSDSNRSGAAHSPVGGVDFTPSF